MSGIETVNLPESLKIIGSNAFLHCDDLKDINLQHFDELQIGEKAFTGCKNLVDEDGTLIIQNRLFTFYRESEDVIRAVIPDNVNAIEGDAFDQFGHFNIEMSINCPVWPTYGAAKKYGFARSLINRDGSTEYSGPV